MTSTNGYWVVCCGSRVVAGLLATKDEAISEAQKAIRDGCSPVSVHQVGCQLAVYPSMPGNYSTGWPQVTA